MQHTIIARKYLAEIEKKESNFLCSRKVTKETRTYRRRSNEKYKNVDNEKEKTDI